MPGFIVTFAVGVICILLGIRNMKGDISSLHSYHTHRVSEADRLPFGRKVGLGTILCGAGIMLFGIFSGAAMLAETQVLLWIGMAFLFAGLGAGMGIALCAMVKYNGGIF